MYHGSPSSFQFSSVTRAPITTLAVTGLVVCSRRAPSALLGEGPPSSSRAALRFAVGCPGRKMPSGAGPDLKKYMDKRLAIKLNGNRTINGTLRGFDQFMNLVLDETVEQVTATEQNSIGMVVIRGNSIVMIEALEKLWD